MYDIISVGSATFDVFFKSKRFPLDKLSIGEKIEADEFLPTSGGGGSNTAVGFSRLGLKTACIARFGDDLFGQFVLQDLKKETFDKKFLQQKKGDTTDYSTILISPNGSRTIIVSRGKTRLEEKDFPFKALELTKNLYIASVEGNTDLLKEIVNRSYHLGVSVYLNPGSREIKDKEKITSILPKLKLLILNNEEAEEFGFKNSQMIIRPEMMIITNGRQGAKLFSSAGNYFIESFLTPAVDETGAGDAFSSGFVGGLLLGLSIEDSLKLGMANGASVVRYIGAKTGLIGKADIKEWMSKRLRIEKIK